jgi:hypothetical protein
MLHRTLAGPMPTHAASCSGGAVMTRASDVNAAPSVCTSVLFTARTLVITPAVACAVRSAAGGA